MKVGQIFSFMSVTYGPIDILCHHFFSLAYFTVATFNLSLVDIHICTFADIQVFSSAAALIIFDSISSK